MDLTFPNVPNVTPTINLSRNEVVNLLLASIAFEELGLAHIINAEAEKIQTVLGTLPGVHLTATSGSQLLSVNQLVEQTLRTVIKKEMLLQFKLEEILIIPTSTTSTMSTTSSTTSSSTTSTTSTASPTTSSSTTSTTRTTTSTTTTTTAATNCSYVFKHGDHDLPAILTIMNPSKISDAVPIKVRMTCPNTPPSFDIVLVDFNDQSSTNGFDFISISSPQIVRCHATLKDAVIEGTGTIGSTTYDLLLYIETAGSKQTATFIFTNPDDTFELVVDTSSEPIDPVKF